MTWWSESDVIEMFQAYQRRLVESLQSESDVFLRDRDYFTASVWAQAARMVQAQPYNRLGPGPLPTPAPTPIEQLQKVYSKPDGSLGTFIRVEPYVKPQTRVDSKGRVTP